MSGTSGTIKFNERSNDSGLSTTHIVGLNIPFHYHTTEMPCFSYLQQAITSLPYILIAFSGKPKIHNSYPTAASWLGGGARRTMAPNCFEIIGFSEILMFRRKIFGLLLLVKIKVPNIVGKSFELGPPYSTGATTHLLSNILFF